MHGRASLPTLALPQQRMTARGNTTPRYRCGKARPTEGTRDRQGKKRCRWFRARVEQASAQTLIETAINHKAQRVHLPSSRSVRGCDHRPRHWSFDWNNDQRAASDKAVGQVSLPSISGRFSGKGLGKRSRNRTRLAPSGEMPLQNVPRYRPAVASTAEAKGSPPARQIGR